MTKLNLAIIFGGMSSEYEVSQNSAAGVLTNVDKEKSQIAEVVAVGLGGNVEGNNIEMDVKVGDKVIINKYAGTEIKYEGEDLIIVKQNDILAIVE